MQLKHLSLAALSGVAADNLGEHDATHQSRKLQLPTSVTCLSLGSPVADCCPEGDLSDAVCVLLACVNLDDFNVKEGCDCTQIVDSCSGLALAYAIVPGMEDMCNQVGTCCEEGAVVPAPNDSFNACLGCAQKDGGLERPNLSAFGAFLGGALPDATETDADPFADLVCEGGAAPGNTTAAEDETTAGADETDAAEDAGNTTAAEDETGAAGGASPGDVDASPDGAEEPSAACAHAARALMPLVGAVTAILLS